MKSIELNSVSFRYTKDLPLFEALSVRFASQSKRGHISAIMGPSGSGKTTLLKLILGIEKQQNGSLQMTPAAPCVSYLPQSIVLFEHLSPLENARYFANVSSQSSRFDEGRFSSLSDTLGLTKTLRKSKTVREMSGGQRQRLSLLRALSVNPDFLLLDEPCIGLDAEVKRNFILSLLEIVQANDIVALYVTHQQVEARMVADDIVYIQVATDGGRTPIRKNTSEFFDAPPTIGAAHAFLFPDFEFLPVKLSGDIVVPSTSEAREFTIAFERLRLGDEARSGVFQFDVAGILDSQALLRERLSREVVRSAEKPDSTQVKALLAGRCLLYDREGRFHQELYL